MDCNYLIKELAPVRTHQGICFIDFPLSAVSKGHLNLFFRPGLQNINKPKTDLNKSTSAIGCFFGSETCNPPKTIDPKKNDPGLSPGQKKVGARRLRQVEGLVGHQRAAHKVHGALAHKLHGGHHVPRACGRPRCVFFFLVGRHQADSVQ